MIAVWIFAALLAYLGLGAFVAAPFRAHRPRPELVRVRDQKLDIATALERGRR